MNEITVLNKGNVPTGPFTRQQIAGKLRTGEVSLTDLAFMPGLTQWTPLREVLAQIDGVPLSAASSASVAAVPAYSYAATMQPPAHLVYGGFWLRFVAYLLDSLILGLPLTFLCGMVVVVIVAFTGMASLFASSHGTDSSPGSVNAAIPVGVILLELFLFVAIFFGSWLYYALLESGPGQATYGKRIVGLRVTDMTGARISFGHASGRFFGKIITGLLPLAIGYIMAGFTERKQALHDLIAGTLVVRN